MRNVHATRVRASASACALAACREMLTSTEWVAVFEVLRGVRWLKFLSVPL